MEVNKNSFIVTDPLHVCDLSPKLSWLLLFLARGPWNQMAPAARAALLREERKARLRVCEQKSGVSWRGLEGTCGPRGGEVVAPQEQLLEAEEKR